jgi:hypothetical protein
MEPLPELVAVLIGFLLRIAVPVGITALVAWLLRRLDARWQAEAEEQARKAALTPSQNGREVVGKGLRCWEVRGCPPERRESCPAYLHPEIPCWQILRAPTGQLRKGCLECEVFRDAPLPLAT